MEYFLLNKLKQEHVCSQNILQIFLCFLACAVVAAAASPHRQRFTAAETGAMRQKISAS